MSDANDPCIFCVPRDVTRRNELAYCTRDSYPVSRGHALVVPFRHCADFFELSTAEVNACFELVGEEKLALDAELGPDGYNIGVNVNPAAGQSIFHVHIHLIPRYRGDTDNPQGGVRHVVPGRGHYVRKGSGK